MAKSKKNIGAFQQAMLNNTKMITADEETSSKKGTGKTAGKLPENTGSSSEIDPELYKKLETIGKKYGIETEILINKGIELFVELEEFLFKE